ncbi:hypothetical protein GY45DRAFT_1332261 [Cubamyces sp. BRFM 1775]|nr:hypothetical protein GY45DRAFT_1332261 [Cubamyces sp. BRFM 1775]
MALNSSWPSTKTFSRGRSYLLCTVVGHTLVYGGVLGIGMIADSSPYPPIVPLKIPRRSRLARV